VTGGWGVDALLGRQTRKHNDLDLVVDARDAAAAVRALAEIGYIRYEDPYEHVPGALLPDRRVLLSADGRALDLHPVDLATWPPAGDISPFATGTIGNRPAPCLSAVVQRMGHRGYPLDDADRHDLRVLDHLEPDS
jgi:lincosamide nucleotidyltransferase A/C/D/E